MKKIIFIIILAALFSKAFTQNVVFHEGFENIIPPALPDGWTQYQELGSYNWETYTGGHAGNPTDYAPQGEYNAIFQHQSSNGETTKLITPPIDLSEIIKPELRFKHAQDIWYAGEEDWDQLKVYYRKDEISDWVLLEEYLYPVTSWVDRTILLPDSSLSSTYYIAFEGITGYGHGVLIDTVHIVETGVTPLYIESINVKQTNSSFIPSGTDNNPIIRVEINVLGNEGTLTLNSICFNSLNTSDDIIKNNGVKLYYTEDTIFGSDSIIETGNFASGEISFENMDYSLERGLSTFWLTYDIKEDVDHSLHGNIADAMVKESDIKVENSYYPFIDKSPSSSRMIVESIFTDNFETDKGWRFTGEFERDTARGKHANQLGNADPDYAFSGVYIIGTDISDDGNYSNGLADTAWVAEIPSLDLKYYKDITFAYYRWLNIQNYEVDQAKIMVLDQNNNWNIIWHNPTLAIVNENIWRYHSFDLTEYFNRNENSRLKFTLGKTNSSSTYTGWNIDDIIIVGNYISKDVGISDWVGPLSGCGHNTNEEYVEVTIQNYAGEALTDPLPISYSFDGGENIYYDTIQSPNISIDGSINHIIDKPADLSTPGWYNNVYATTHLVGDEDNSNNRLNTSVFITPTYELPYSENFETNYGYYLSGGTYSTWGYGIPSNTLIDAAASGDNAWVTNLIGDYETNDSSYLLSPCFDFSGADSIVFEFKCKGISEDKTDGLSLLYSIDQGANWSLVPDDDDFYWDWYNEPLISELELPGFDDTDGEWKTFRQLLPKILSNNSNVKFKFVFESNGSINYEGFGIDDVKIYDAPYDVGVSDITEPFTDCYWDEATQVKVEIENFGITAVKAGTKIPIGLRMNDVHIITDTLELAVDLEMGIRTSFTFTETIDMSAAGDYEFEAYTLLEDDPYFYDETTCNDTTIEIVTVQGMPGYNPFQDQIGVSLPVDTFLAAGTGYSDYAWSGGGSPDITLPRDTLYISNEGWYYVTVTNADGCTAKDSVEVLSSLIDVEMYQLLTTLDNLCERTEPTELSVRIMNKAVDDLTSANDDTVFLAYQINELPKVQDTLVVTSTIASGATEDFTFTVKADFTVPDSYTLKVFVDYLKDLNHNDDTLTKPFLTKGYVDIDFDPDTIYSSEADTLLLSPEPTYTAYSWSTASTDPSITPATNISQWYYVTVSDAIACDSDDDSVYVETYDFAIDSIKSPHSDCAFTNAENIELYVFNHSGNTYTTGTKIPFRFNFDGLGWIDDTITLTSDFDPETTEIITLDKTIDPYVVKEYSLEVTLNAKQDANSDNDGINHNFETWGYPSVDLPYDTILTTQADTIVLEVSEGFGTYAWNQDVSNDSSIFVVTDNFSQKYIVTVTDIHGCGSDKDSTSIFTYNVGILELVSPTSGCEHDYAENVTVKIKNFSNDVMKKDSIIPVGYKLDGANAVIEYMTLEADLNPSATVNYTFAETEDLSGIETYRFDLFTDLELDVRPTNDTLVEVIRTFGYPSIELGDDILTTNPTSVVLNVPTGYNHYIWNDGTTTNSLSISYPATRQYSVTVTDINGCTTSDDINVFTYDIAASEIVSPINECELSNSESVSFDVINNSLDTLLENDVINVSYTINSGSPVNESFALEVDSLKPGEAVNYTFTQAANLSTNQDYTFELYAEYPNYDAETNDAISREVDYQKTELALGPDINTGEAQHTIDAGVFKTYLWFDEETTTRTYTVDINDQNPNYYYAVTVTNDYDCVDYDSVKVEFSTTASIDLTDMPTPVDACWQESESYPVKVIITNSGVVNLNSGTEFTVEYNVDGGTPVVETFDISETMTSGDTKEYTFTEEVSFATAKVYTIETSVKLTNDESIIDNLSTNIDISAPEVSLGLSDTISFETSTQLSTSVPYTTYEWSTGDETPTITVTEEGKYSVTVTDANGCQGEGWIYCKKNTTGIDHLIQGADYQISFYPNPVSDQLMIQFDNQKSKDIFVEILSSNGQVIYTRKLDDIENTIERIDVNPYANGIYYLRIQVDQELYTRKVIIQ